jgi:gluconate kinase
MDMSITIEHLRNWIPIRAFWEGQQLSLDWCFMDERRFTEPFFDQTIEKRFREPFNLLFQHCTSIGLLGELYEKSPGVPPSGFIFHLSRCGSTLVSQMLAALSLNIVVSEASPIDAVLRSNLFNAKVSDTQRAEWLKWIVNAFGQQRSAEEKHYFIKFDSWHAFHLDLIRAAFPNVPFIFLYRNPVEIIVSQIRQRGAQMIPGVINQLLPDTDLQTIIRMPPEEYCARILAEICQHTINFARTDSIKLINYSQLPQAVITAISSYFGLDLSELETEMMAGAAQFNAKTPQLYFEPDATEKRAAATDAARFAAAKYVDRLYQGLEDIRLARIS